MVDQEEIHKQCLSDDPAERIKGINQLKNNFSLLSDKEQAWSDLTKLAFDRNSLINSKTAYAIVSVFYHVPDKKSAWSDLVRLITSKDCPVRYKIVDELNSVFSQLPHKQVAWNDLIKLCTNKKDPLRFKVINFLGHAFSQIPYKELAWQDLHELTKDDDHWVKSGVTLAIGFAFLHLLDTKEAWEDLHTLTKDENDFVRKMAASAIGYAFSQIPNKPQALKDLDELTADNSWVVRAHAHRSLGRISIFKASKAEKEEDYRNELERAILFFDQAGNSERDEPSQFCLPFYRAYHAIVFGKHDSDKEVDEYIKKANDAVEGSKRKKLLIEVIETLANALKEAQNIENIELETMRSELNFYRKYCEHASELLDDAEEATPYTTATIRKGLPILDRNLKGLIEEIQNKAKIACQESQGTSTKEIASDVYREVQKWEISSQEEMTSNVSKVVMVLKSKIPHTLENKEILDMIESMKYEKDLTRQYSILPIIIGLIPTVNVVPVEPILDEIKELKASVGQLITSIDKLPNRQEYLDIIQKDLKEIKDYMPGMKEKIDEVLCELYTPFSTTQKLKIAIPIIPSIVSYEQETDVPEFVAENIQELKNLFYKMKDSLKKLR